MATKKEKKEKKTTAAAEERDVGGETKFADPSVYKRVVIADDSADISDDFLTLDIHVSIWEVQTEKTISARWQKLETQELQIRSTKDQLEANGAKSGDDYAQLTVKHNEIIRQMEHMKKTISPGSVIMLGKIKGVVQVKPGMEWNKCLDRHVVINDGKIERVLWKNPI